MPLSFIAPKRTSPVGTDASGKPVYQGADGRKIYGLPDARAAQNYHKAVGGPTRMPDMTSPTFRGYSMGRGWKNNDLPEGSYRNAEGQRVVRDKDGNEVPVGNRINARAGNKAVEARDEENAKFFNRARAVNQPQRPQPAAAPAAPGAQAGQAGQPGQPQADIPAAGAGPQQERPLNKFVTHPYKTTPHSVNDPEFQRPGNAVYDTKQKARKLTPVEQETANSWAKFDATPYGQSIKKARR